MSPSASTIVHVVAALVGRPDGTQLIVRKRGTHDFQQPGGKPEQGESSLATLHREMHEEIGVDLALANVSRRGLFRAPAAHEPGSIVEAEIFDVVLPQDVVVRPHAEIEAVEWIVPGHTELVLAPLTADLMQLLV